jgi:hypothetical protein
MNSEAWHVIADVIGLLALGAILSFVHSRRRSSYESGHERAIGVNRVGTTDRKLAASLRRQRTGELGEVLCPHPCYLDIGFQGPYGIPLIYEDCPPATRSVDAASSPDSPSLVKRA